MEPLRAKSVAHRTTGLLFSPGHFFVLVPLGPVGPDLAGPSQIRQKPAQPNLETAGIDYLGHAMFHGSADVPRQHPEYTNPSPTAGRLNFWRKRSDKLCFQANYRVYKHLRDFFPMIIK